MSNETQVPLADKTLWDSLGNSCRCTLYYRGAENCELWLQDFNDSIPVRYVGTIGVMVNKGDLWIESKKAQGFQEQLPSYNPHVWNP